MKEDRSSFSIEHHNKVTWIFEIDPTIPKITIVAPTQKNYAYNQFLFLLRSIATVVAWLEMNLTDIERTVNEKLEKESSKKKGDSETPPNISK